MVWLMDELGQTAVRALRANGFDAVYVPNAEAARAAVLARIPAGATIGFGGSGPCRRSACSRLWRPAALTCSTPPTRSCPTTSRSAMPCAAAPFRPTWLMASANAITLDGEIVSTDGTGNRWRSTCSAPSHDPGGGRQQDRARHLSSAQAAHPPGCRAGQRPAAGHARPAPCYTTGICDDAACTSHDRICNATVILHKKPAGIERFSVIVVGEDLGF